MEAWIGPAIIAAIVSAIVSIIGWVVTFRMSLRLEQMRRDEKVHDFQVALRAEISSDLLNLVVVDREEFFKDIAGRYAHDPHFSVVVAHMAPNPIFEAIVKDIHILPGEVIAPLVNYSRLRQTIEKFVLDLRADSFRQMANDRQLLMYSDYLEMLDRLEALAQNAVAALDRSLGLNSPGAAPSSRGSASERGEALSGDWT